METITNQLPGLYEAAKRAFAGISFSPEKRASQTVADYTTELSNDLATMKTEEQQKRYIDNYRKYLFAWLNSHSRIMSTMITGPSNFPVKRMEKYRNWEENKYKEFREWRERALKAITREIERSKTPEEKANDFWIQVRDCILHSANVIYEIDNGIEKGCARELFVRSIIGTVKTHVKNGRPEVVKKCLALIRELNAKSAKPIVTDKHSIWQYEQMAEIKQEIISDAAKQESAEIEINGIKILDNYEADRVQMFFDGKPAQHIINALKSAAWKWSPSNMCWQRKLTGNAQYSAKQIAAIQ